MDINRIRQLNDALRRRGRVLAGSPEEMRQLPPLVLAIAMGRLRRYWHFAPDSDPLEEHDHGSFWVSLDDETWHFYWNIQVDDEERDNPDAKRTLILSLYPNA